MYYVPDGTKRCGFYECDDCGTRFLDIKTGPMIVCPYCGEEPDMEVGPDEETPFQIMYTRPYMMHSFSFAFTYFKWIREESKDYRRLYGGTVKMSRCDLLLVMRELLW